MNWLGYPTLLTLLVITSSVKGSKSDIADTSFTEDAKTTDGRSEGENSSDLASNVMIIANYPAPKPSAKTLHEKRRSGDGAREKSEFQNSLPKTCGVTDDKLLQANVFPQVHSGASRSRRKRRQAPRQNAPTEAPETLWISGGDVRGTRRYVEVHLVADARLSRRMNHDDRKLQKFTAEIISYTNALFEPLEISVVLKKLEVWNNGDKTSITERHDETLENFKRHRIGQLMEDKDFDVTLLLTDIDFESTTIGYAIVGSMCSGTAVAVVQTRGSDELAVSHTVAHELGHVLGMFHDEASCTCNDTSCVMAEELKGLLKPTMEWSSCSKMQLARHFVHGEFSCLQDIPRASRGRQYEHCGDGVVDSGEQCDCGPAGTCRNPCCDPLTCKFRENATCASGDCCDLTTCRQATASTPCRQARGECDLPEFCSGWSEVCPHDVYVHDGAPCDDGQGHCVAGKCGSHRVRCETLFGPATVPAPDRCFANNVLGREGQNCGLVRSSLTYRKCNPDSLKCGSIYCTPPTDLIVPRAGIMLWSNSAQCFTAYAQNVSSVPGLELAPDGSKCGDGKMCLKQRCVSVPPPPEGCMLDGCGVNGVCNSKGRCHCSLGFAPPHCDVPGFGGSRDSGHMADPTVTSNTDRSLYLIFLVIIPLMCGICASLCCLSVSWENYKKQEHYQPSICNNKIGAYLCCFSAQVTKLLIESGIMAKPGLPTENIDGDPSEIEKLNPSPSQRRNTIFQVDVNVQTSKLANSSWGTANDALFTDVITVTPKNSPDLHRKVRLPSDSPLLHHRSQDIEQRPKYGKSFSSDSGCVSDLEEHRGKPDMNMSMSSLVNIVMKYGRGDRSRGSSAEPEIPNPKQFVTQKSVPLSRLVLDPYGPKSNVKTAGNSSLEVQRPGFNRSLSSDAATSQSVTADLPKSGYLTPKKSTSSINTNSSSDSESFYVNIPSEIKKGGNIGRCSPPEDLKVKNQHTVFKASRKAPQIPKIKIEDSDAKITKHKKGSIKPNCADSNPSEQTELKSAAKKPMLPPQSKTSNNNRPLPTTTNIPGVTPGMAMDKISGGSKVSLDQPKARPPIKDTGSRSFREQPSQGSENSNEFLIKFNQVKNKESNTSSATPSVAEQTFSQSAPRRPMLPPTKRS